MVLACIDQFDMLAAQIDEHPISEGEIGNRGGWICGLKNIRPSCSMADKDCLAGKDAAAGDVVVMMMAVHYIAHRLIREFFDLRLQPGRRFGADRISDDHPL